MATPDETNAQPYFTDSVAAVVLAAGKSSRMKSKLPKTLHSICGRPLLVHILVALANAGATRRIVVVGHEAEKVREVVDAHFGAGAIEYVYQTEQQGTGHAVQMAQNALSGSGPAPQTVLVAAGDAPLLTAAVFGDLLHSHQQTGAAATLLSAVLPGGANYGRIVRSETGAVLGIVEAKDASPEEIQICEINAGVYAFQTNLLFPALASVRPANAQNEIYLTDVIGLLRHGHTVGAFVSPNADVVLGVNTRVELAHVGAKMRRALLQNLMLGGVTIVDPGTTYVDAGVKIGQDTMLLPNTHVLGNTIVGEDSVLGPNAHIQNAHIGSGVRARACFIEGATVGDGCRIGPFAHIRPGSVLEKNVRIGNFVETKAAHLHENVAAGHLSYLGDAEVGANTNIGAGTITCNYDGEKKHRTVIGDHVFVGSHTAFVAPVTVGDGAATGAGSVITREIPPGDLGVARARQTNIAGWAARRTEKRNADKTSDSVETPASNVSVSPEGNPAP